MQNTETVLTTYSTSVQYNAPWHPLKHAWVGRSYLPAFYEPVKDTHVRDTLQRIAEETEQDYQALTATLNALGVKVERPEINESLTIMDFVDQQNGQLNYSNAHSYTLIPRPPMQPRDAVLVVGDQLVATSADRHWFSSLIANLNLPTGKFISSQRNFDAPMATVVGNHIIVDCREEPWLHEYFVTTFPDRTIIPVSIGGHNDAVFSLVKPGVVISTYHHSNYTETLPGWEVKYIENQSWNAIPEWRKLKHSNQGKWWIPDNLNNPEFSTFVESWITNWLGYVEETVFDVNMLQINERQVIVNNYNKEMFEFFKRHNIEPIVISFRHRFFWDGGIHCITNDIYRDGPIETYIKR